MNESSLLSQARQKTKDRWWYRPFWVWILILSIGPFALPFLILSPGFSRISKIIISVLIIGSTVYFLYYGIQTFYLMKNPDELKSFLKNHLSPDQMELINLFLDGI